MAAVIPVTLFNANVLDVQVAINASPDLVFVGATNASLAWQPTPTFGAITMTTSGPPSGNVLAIGLNSLAITPSDRIQPMMSTIDMPGTTRWSSVQLYIYFNTYADVTWAILNGGQFVLSGSTGA